MPRSVNNVWRLVREKKDPGSSPKGFFGRKKTFGPLRKMQLKGRVCIPRRKQRKNSEPSGFQRINTGVRPHGLNYSSLSAKLKKSGIDLNRKVLADLAMNRKHLMRWLTKWNNKQGRKPLFNAKVSHCYAQKIFAGLAAVFYDSPVVCTGYDISTRTTFPDFKATKAQGKAWKTIPWKRT